MRGLGGLTYTFDATPADPGAYRQEQDLYRSEVRSILPFEKATVRMRSFTADAGNVLVTELWTEGSAPIEVTLKIWSHTNGSTTRAFTGDGIIGCTREINTTMGTTRQPFHSAVAMASRVLGATPVCETDRKNSSTAGFTLDPGARVRVVTVAAGGYRATDPDLPGKSPGRRPRRPCDRGPPRRSPRLVERVLVPVLRDPQRRPAGEVLLRRPLCPGLFEPGREQPPRPRRPLAPERAGLLVEQIHAGLQLRVGLLGRLFLQPAGPGPAVLRRDPQAHPGRQGAGPRARHQGGPLRRQRPRLGRVHRHPDPQHEGQRLPGVPELHDALPLHPGRTLPGREGLAASQGAGRPSGKTTWSGTAANRDG